MSEKVEITTYVSDMIAVEKEILSPVKTQLEDPDVQSFAEVHLLLSRLRTVLEEHVDHLEHHLETLGGHPASGLKSAVSHVFGAAASAVQSVRKTKVSKSLRDDHTALSLVCVAYEMLYTSSLVTRNETTGKIALQHLEDLTSIVMEISEIIPGAVVKELLELDPTLDGDVLSEVNGNISNAWRNGAKEKEQTPLTEQYATT